jgi:cytochrome c biogenesis protein
VATDTSASPVIADGAHRAGLDTRPREPRPPGLGPLGWARWAWRLLTSMRTALVLLLLLALAAVPGSLLPQRAVNPVTVAQYFRANPEVAPWLDQLSLFDVYRSPWFAAVYLLLVISLLGCVIPRTRLQARALLARPPAAPRVLSRLPGADSWVTMSPPEEVLAAARAELRRRWFRVDRSGDALAAEKGYLRETGNLLFHAALLGVLGGVVLGSLFAVKGSVLVEEGEGFANTPVAYDEFTPGRLVDSATLPPFAFTLEDFRARFAEDGPQRGAAREFAADVTWRPTPDAPERRTTIRVNHPLDAGGETVYLIGHGYAPRFTIRDADGEVVFSDAVPFLPQDGNFSSSGVLKVPDGLPRDLGVQAWFLPTAVIDPQRGPVSVFPDAKAPAVFLTAYAGDLGLDAGLPQSVYQLDTDRLSQLEEDGEPFRAQLNPGDTVTLPDGMGTLAFDGYVRWANFRIARDPGGPVVLGSAVLALVGLALSLAIRRRRIWLRATPAGDGRTVVDAAGLTRADSTGRSADFTDLMARLRAATGGVPVVPVAPAAEED